MSASFFDFHTHDLSAPPGRSIVSLPLETLLCAADFSPRPGVLYSAGIHPWWTCDDAEPLFQGLECLVERGAVVAVGECGLDRLRGAALGVQQEIFGRQIALAERYALPVTVHCVRAFDVLLGMHKRLRPSTRWTVHGFRGRPALARQLLAAGLDLSFGSRYHPDSFALTPPSRRHLETDGADAGGPIPSDL